MVPTPSSAPAARAAPSAGSDRVRLATAAGRAALATPGVAGLRAGPLGLQSTSGAGERIDGVVCATLPDGRLEVSLHVTTTLTPLPQLVEQLRERVLGAARVAGLAARVGPVNIVVEDVVGPGEEGL